MNMTVAQAEKLTNNLRENFNNTNMGTYSNRDDKASYLHGKKPIKIKFYANGDKYFTGKKISLHSYRYRNMDELMSELTNKMPPQVYLPSGIRQIFSPHSGRKIVNISQLENDREYVCAGNESFKNVPYGHSERDPWFKGRPQHLLRFAQFVPFGLGLTAAQAPSSIGNGNNKNSSNSITNSLYARYNAFPSRYHPHQQQMRIAPPGVYYSFGKVDARNTVMQQPAAYQQEKMPHKYPRLLKVGKHGSQRHRYPHYPQRTGISYYQDVLNNQHLKPRVITVVRNSSENPKIFTRMLLNKRNIQSFEVILSEIETSLTEQVSDQYVKGVTKIYNLLGKEIKSVTDFFKNEEFFIAVGEEESLDEQQVKSILDDMYPHHPQTDQILKFWTHKIPKPHGTLLGQENNNNDATKQSKQYKQSYNQGSNSTTDKRDSGFEDVSEEYETNTSEITTKDKQKMDSADIPKPILSKTKPTIKKRKHRNSVDMQKTEEKEENMQWQNDKYSKSYRSDQYKNAERLKAVHIEREKVKRQHDQEIERERQKIELAKKKDQNSSESPINSSRKSTHGVKLSPLSGSEVADLKNKDVKLESESSANLYLSNGKLRGIQEDSAENLDNTQLIPTPSKQESVAISEQKTERVTPKPENVVIEKLKTTEAEEMIPKPENEVVEKMNTTEAEEMIPKPKNEVVEKMNTTEAEKVTESIEQDNKIEEPPSSTDKIKSTVKEDPPLNSIIQPEQNKITEQKNDEKENKEISQIDKEDIEKSKPAVTESKTDRNNEELTESQTSTTTVTAMPNKKTINLPGTRILGKLCRQITTSGIVYERFDTSKILGDGNFAVVKLAVKKENVDSGRVKAKREYALKIIDKSKMRGKETMIENEIWIMKLCHHPNIIYLEEEYETKEEVFLIMELVKGGDLFDAITQSVKFSEPIAAKMVTDVASALFYLHSRHIVHRDLKPENLLVLRRKDGTLSLKLADFGLAMEVKKLIYTVCGTPTYVAPEILTERGYSLEVDLWALGVITYILLCGFPPFRSPNRDQDQLFEMIKSGNFQFISPYWDNISHDVKELIKRLLVVNRRTRYTSVDVLSHSWIMTQGHTHSVDDEVMRNRTLQLEKQSQENAEQFQRDKQQLKCSINKEIQQTYLNNTDIYRTKA